LLEESVTDMDQLVKLLENAGENGHAYSASVIGQSETEIVVRTTEAKTGLAATHHVPKAVLEAKEYRRLTQVHDELVALVGMPPFNVEYGNETSDAVSFEELRQAVLDVSQKGVSYYRFKGLGEMDPEELRETTMDPSTRTLVQVTMEDASAADRVFAMLMGDQVEPRRAFIEENARSVANLDV
ncbi:MAG: DNA gyrase subunit B, partial [Solirubrobacterales bacterium]|nr:DNA gyrase subunit B [Solirubrobacterales bacterium]